MEPNGRDIATLIDLAERGDEVSAMAMTARILM
jgi:hypothetical protein